MVLVQTSAVIPIPSQPLGRGRLVCAPGNPHAQAHISDVLAISSAWISEGFCPACSADAQDASWHGEVNRKQPMGDSDG